LGSLFLRVDYSLEKSVEFSRSQVVADLKLVLDDT